jgi:hypothetical protein
VKFVVVTVCGEAVRVGVRSTDPDPDEVLARAQARLLAKEYGRGAGLWHSRGRVESWREDGTTYRESAVVGRQVSGSFPVLGTMRWTEAPGTHAENVARIEAARKAQL